MNKNNKKKANKNSSNKFIALLIGILGISLVVALVVISMLQKDSPSSFFLQDTSLDSEKIYNNILNLSEDNFPKTPEEIVNLYADSYKLLYGNRIKSEHINTVLPIILEKQRILFSDQLTNNNPIEEQINSVKESINFLLNNKLKVTNIEILPAIYSQENPNISYVNVKIQDNTLNDEEKNSFTYYYYKYYLERGVDEKWRITGFYPTDENFNLIN